MSPQTGRIYDRTRFGGNPVSGISLDIREESIYGLLDEENRGMKTRLATMACLTWRGNAYWRGDEGPFCPRCWDVDAKLVHMQDGVSQLYETLCPQCKTAADRIPSEIEGAK
jgi:hypothetical protein